MTMCKFREQFRAARMAATPIVAIETSEPASCIRNLQGLLNDAPCIVSWDIIRGAVPIGGQEREDAFVEMCKGIGRTGTSVGEMSGKFADPKTLWVLANALPCDSAMVLHNAHHVFKAASHGAIQILWNLRDVCKERGVTLCLLAPSWSVPDELAQDVTIMRDPLPDDIRLAEIVRSVHAAVSQANEIPPISNSDMTRACSALRGLSPFAAEQATAESMRPRLDIDMLWARKREIVNRTRGAKFISSGLRYADIGGHDAVKAYFSRLFSGPSGFDLVVRVDEAEKQFGGSKAEGDNGVGKNLLQTVLREMTTHNYRGTSFAGSPGTGKSILSEAIAIEHGVPMIEVDLSAVKGGIVGESERGIRDLFSMIEAIAPGGRVLFIACVNKMTDSMPPELKRRFTNLGLWYFNLPTAEERAGIVEILLRRYPSVTGPLPDMDDWTGADIRACIETAYALGITPAEAAVYVVPVAQADPESIAELRVLADGRWLSTHTPGVYRMQRAANTTTTPDGSRRMRITAPAAE